MRGDHSGAKLVPIQIVALAMLIQKVRGKAEEMRKAEEALNKLTMTDVIDLKSTK